jgi:hypothetical protein
MAEFAKVAAEMTRMCGHYEGFCKECPLGFAASCRNWVIGQPEEAEEIIMKWAAEHPLVTNEAKFEEIFGVPFWAISCRVTPAISEWIKSEYKEAKK